MTGSQDGTARIAIIDDHEGVRRSLRALLESAGFAVEEYVSAEDFLANASPSLADCLIVDIRMPGMSGLELQEELVRRRIATPTIVVTGHGDVPLAVQAMRAGTFDFLEKPFDDDILLASVHRALSAHKEARHQAADAEAAMGLLMLLTARERDVLNHLALGKSNKLIGHALGISPRTVEIHRARVLEKMHALSVADLIRTLRAADAMP